MEMSGIVMLATLLVGIILTFIYFNECKNNPPFLFLLLLFFSAVTKQMSVMFLELNPIYMSETDMVSKYTGASYRLFIGNMLIFVAAAITIRILYIRTQKPFWKPAYVNGCIFGPLGNEAKFIILILLMILTLQFINFIFSSGLPITTPGVDRWNYWENYAYLKFLPILFGKLMIFYAFLLGALGYYVTRTKSMYDKMIVLIITTLYFLYLYISGQKVNGVIAPFLIVSASFLSSKIYYENRIDYRKLVKIGVSVFLVLAITGYFAVQSRSIGELAGSGISVFLYRVFVLTGASIWTVDFYVNYASSQGHSGALIDGMNTLIQLVMPPDIAEKFVERGVNLSGGLPAMAYYALGWGKGSLFLAIYGIGFGVFATILFKNIVKFRLLSITLLSYLFFWYTSSYALSSLEKIIDIKFIVFVFMFFFLKLAASIRSTHVNENIVTLSKA